MCRLIRWFIS